MPRIAYVAKSFGAQSELMIARADAICAEFARQGIDLTLRGLYYRLVARDLFPDSRRWSKNAAGKWVRDENGTKNADPNYKWLGEIINDARLAGRIDWNYLSDVTRSLRDLAHWDDPQQIVDAVANQYRTARWADQPEHVEVWIEKDALVGVISGPCTANDVPYFSCRGYTSQTAMWEAAQRLIRIERDGQKVVIIHLGDHDPSGIDMTRDIRDRLALFGSGAEVIRIALTMDQVEQYQPPPNPAKLSDSRSTEYIDLYGDESWELDALDPAVMAGLLTDEIARHRDETLWTAATERMNTDRFLLRQTSERWPDVIGFLRAGSDAEFDADEEDEGDDNEE
jgi:hypothetical protein